MTASTTTPAALPISKAQKTAFHERASSPVAWFGEDNQTGDDTDHADIWIDHHRVAHERHPTHDHTTRCGRRILGSDAPTHARISAVGCRACAAAHVNTT